MGDRVFGGEEGAADMGGKDGVEGFGGVGLDLGYGAEVASVGEEDVKAVEAGDCGCDASLGLGFEGDVGGDGQGVGAERLGSFGKGLGVAVYQGDVAALGLQEAGGGEAEGACTAGDQGSFAVQARHVRLQNRHFAAGFYRQ